MKKLLVLGMVLAFILVMSTAALAGSKKQMYNNSGWKV
jgi:hypothetical protein